MADRAGARRREGAADSVGDRSLQDRSLKGRCILQIIPRLMGGGAEQVTIDLARALASDGARALVASRGGRLEGDLAAAGGIFVSLSADTKNPYSLYRNAGRLARLIRREGVDLVHVHSRAPAWSALLAAQRTGRPLITSYHGVYDPKNGLKRFYNSVMVRGDAVIAHSDFVARRVTAQHGLPRERIDVIPLGVDLARFDPAAVDPARVADLRAGWGAGSDKAVLLLPARFTKLKGHRVLLEALLRMKRQGTHRDDWVAVLMGPSDGKEDYLAGLKAMVAGTEIADQVHFEPHHADMPAAYRAADIVLSISVAPETFGLVAVEAQALARPVIATDHGGARETVLTEEDPGRPAPTGWRVPPEDVEALGRALESALHLDGAARAAMGARGRRHVEARFVLSRMTDRTLALYHRVLGAGSGRAPARGTTEDNREAGAAMRPSAMGDSLHEPQS